MDLLYVVGKIKLKKKQKTHRKAMSFNKVPGTGVEPVRFPTGV